MKMVSVMSAGDVGSCLWCCIMMMLDDDGGGEDVWSCDVR